MKTRTIKAKGFTPIHHFEHESGDTSIHLNLHRVTKVSFPKPRKASGDTVHVRHLELFGTNWKGDTVKIDITLFSENGEALKVKR